ncbi:protein FAM227B-like isoform X1 [Rhincodon typus]|uniref:protein FAM227B-like isoform X1 n=1 Tax=Rhincodon typus TaxID=259920 RepID=UPI00202F5EE9|nr:protein FAM227B-like isoform X1 [Rhincodon typus]XP_048471789.1 protein FAM227B-like isoform X1 [Rhincodon typus]
MENLSKDLEEFLHLEDLINWPELLPDEDEFQMNIQPGVFSSYESTVQYIHEHAPFQMEILDDIEQRINQFVPRLEKYSSKILSDKPGESKIKEHHIDLSSYTFLTQIKNSDALLTHPSRKLSEELSFANSDVTVQSERFPGFKPFEFTELPGHTEAVQLLSWIWRAQNFNLGYQSTLKKLILSTSSGAILQDAFWWFFLSKFQPSQEDQDNLFSRIADSFVTLFMTCPPPVLDTLLKVYPDCLAQAVFAIFYKSYPESHNHFGDEFKKELTELFSLWITGLKPLPFSWRQWNLEWLVKSISKRGPDRKERILRELELRSAKLTLDFDLGELMKQDTRNLNRRDMPAPKSTSTRPAKTESSYVGHGHEFQRILFRLSGRSPLVSHFLNMKKIKGRSLSTMGPKMQRIEISKSPPLSPTYQDLIKETKKRSKERHQKIIDLHEQTQKALTALRWDRIQFNRKIDRLKKELFNSTEDEIESISNKLIIKAKENKEESQKPSSTETETESETDTDDDYKDDIKCHENLCVLQFSQELLPIITIEKVG